MLLGLVSDVHATPAPLAEALALFAARGVDAVLCAGDIAGYGDELDATVDLLRAHGCHTIAGNHDRWLLADPARSAGEASRAWLAGLPTRLVHDSERVHLLMVHASPPESLMDGIRLLDEQ
ncbi:MAG TPA: metallophosphoesterase family protein, partial [Gammaproteobacteria bacterium]